MGDRSFIARMFDAVDRAFARLGRRTTFTCQLCAGFVTDDIRKAQAHAQEQHAVTWMSVRQPLVPLQVDDERGRHFDYLLSDGRVWTVARKGTP